MKKLINNYILEALVPMALNPQISISDQSDPAKNSFGFFNIVQ